MGNKQTGPAGFVEGQRPAAQAIRQVGPVETTGPRPVTSMRIVIRGARGAGKSSMMQRLQGQKWSERYVATPEIATAHISWSYKTRDDIVNVSRAARPDRRPRPALFLPCTFALQGLAALRLRQTQRALGFVPASERSVTLILLAGRGLGRR